MIKIRRSKVSNSFAADGVAKLFVTKLAQL